MRWYLQRSLGEHSMHLAAGMHSGFRLVFFFFFLPVPFLNSIFPSYQYFVDSGLASGGSDRFIAQSHTVCALEWGIRRSVCTPYLSLY